MPPLTREPLELKRLISLSSFDIHPNEQQARLGELTRMAATIAGACYSTINILDSTTQWTIAAENMPTGQIDRNQTICQFALDRNEPLEIKNLAGHHAYRHLLFVQQHPELNYYLGLPITTPLGANIGIMCILHKANLELTPEKVTLLKMIADQVVTRLSQWRELEQVKFELNKKKLHIIKLTHDIRTPLSGMIGLTEYLLEACTERVGSKIHKIVDTLNKGTVSLLQLADELMAEEIPSLKQSYDVVFTVGDFARQLDELYQPQAIAQQILFRIEFDEAIRKEWLHKPKLLQIAGNLVSNAIKFTPAKGEVRVELDLVKQDGKRCLELIVADTGSGLDPELVNNKERKANNLASSLSDTGNVYGLTIVQLLVEELEGSIEVDSTEGFGTTFRLLIPQVDHLMPAERFSAN